MLVDTSTGVITWTPKNDDVGEHPITVEVRDGNGGVDSQSFVITVASGSVADDMVLIPAGEFQMGDSFSEHGGDELPVHTVYLDAFYIDRYEVTNSQYAAFLNSYGKNTDGSGNELLDDADCVIEQSGNTYIAKSGYEDHPVFEVSWYGANAYAEFHGKRLPTEAEWEKAARGGLVGKRYPWGNDNPDGTQCNFADVNTNIDWSDKSADDGYSQTAPVGSFFANGYGLYDMAGNVWEWCADWYDSGYYANSPRNNPLGPGSGAARVLRGGSWNNSSGLLRVAVRYGGGSPTYTFYDVGFRCVSQDSSKFDARAREPESLTERASRSPGSVPASGYVTRPKRKPSRAGW